MRLIRPKVLWYLGFAVLLIVVCAAYYPGLGGNFLYDDASNITQNQRLQVNSVSPASLWQAAFSADSGPLKRPISMLSFWANYYTGGLDAGWFKKTNLFIHLVNGCLLLWLSLLLLEGFRSQHETQLDDRALRWAALLAVALWLVHPLALTNVLYVVQRMNSLSALFTIAGLICYVSGRIRISHGQPAIARIVLGLAGFGTLATLSKENGALLPFYMLAIELTIFAGGADKHLRRSTVRWILTASTVIPILLFTGFLLSNPHWLAQHYESRSFSLVQRMMTEPRILWTYLKWVTIPDLRDFGLTHDDISISTGLLKPYSTLLSIAAWGAVVGAAVALRKRAPVFSLAVFWFLLGHAMESSILSLDIAYEHRNYLPMFGPLFAFSYLLAGPLAQQSRTIAAVFATSLIIVLASVTGLRSSEWKDGTTMRLFQVQHHPQSARANYEAGYALGTLIIGNPISSAIYYHPAATYFKNSVRLDPTAINGYFGLILLNQLNGKSLDPNYITDLKNRLSTVPLKFTAIEPFRKLTDWVIKGTVELPTSEVESLFTAAISNPTASDGLKASLFSLLSAYYANAEHNMQDAVTFAIAATKQAPGEPAYHLSLADLAIVLQNYEFARTELREAAQTDTFNRFALKIKVLKRRLGHRAGPASTAEGSMGASG